MKTLNIFFNDDRNLIPTNKIVLLSGEKSPSLLTFLIPKMYENYDLTGKTVILQCLDPKNNVHSYKLSPEEELYDNRYIKFNFKINSKLIESAGILKIYLTIICYSDTRDIEYNFNSRELEITILESPSYMPENILDINKLEDYLYELTYEDLDYEFIEKYLQEKYPPIGMCSSVRRGNYYGRNYDWYYDEVPEFIVHVPATETRHASLAVCPGLEDITNDFVESKIYTDAYKAVPFVVLDGINDAGVLCNINVVPTGDWGTTTGTTPAIRKEKELTSFTLLRFVLDNFSSAQEAVEYIRDYTSVRMLYNDSIQIEAHYMIADSERTYVVEFVDNEISILDVTMMRPFMTNFYLTDMEFENNHVDRNSVTPHSQGIERYELINEKYQSLEDLNDMVELMTKDLKYTKSYNSHVIPFWFTEFTGNYDKYGDITVTSPSSDYLPVVQKAIEQYENRTRKVKETWQTVHSSIYDIENKTLYITPQENGGQHIITLQ